MKHLTYLNSVAEICVAASVVTEQFVFMWNAVDGELLIEPSNVENGGNSCQPSPLPLFTPRRTLQSKRKKEKHIFQRLLI
jgi:hypothetical protein